MVENQYGNGIVCSRYRWAFSPFITTLIIKDDQWITFTTPVYDPTDADNDGVPDNPGNILYYQENYSGNKDSLGLNLD